MNIYVFISLFLLINLVLSAFIYNQKYHFKTSTPLFILSFIFPGICILGILLFNQDFTIYRRIWIFRLFLAFYTTSSLFLKEFVQRFLSNDGLKIPTSFLGRHFPLSFIFRILGIIAIIGSLFAPCVPVMTADNMLLYKCDSLCTAILFVQIVLLLYSFFILENTFRFAEAYQRKIARLCFIGITTILGYQIFFTGNLLLFKFLTVKIVVSAIVVFCICFPLVLIGLLRYRLANERVTIPRDAIYSTVSLFLAGAACIAVGATALGFNYFKLDLAYFDRILILFTLCIFSILIIGSGSMRKRISLFINKFFYSHKYDYHEQFNNLYRSYTTGENVDATLTDIVENIKYSMAADDAFIFIVNNSDGHYHMHQNKERATAGECLIRSDDSLVADLIKTKKPIERIDAAKSNNALPIAEPACILDPKSPIKADVFFPVNNKDSLLGILAIKLRQDIQLDAEDKALIEIFANSIGDVLFKNKILTERMERKQFESFSHLSSFIVHDIKNQAATLSLIVKNAQTNINNPDFQKSLLSSLRSCADNLQALIDKLKSPPKTDAISLKLLNVNSIVDRAIENTALTSLPGVTFAFHKEPIPDIPIDEEALFYSIKNIVNNALESMNFSGSLTIATGKLVQLPSTLQNVFSISNDYFFRFSSFILISDTGCGMSPEFLDKKLFHPFVTTKDKGVGIGLYQCKTLIEKMGGRILCHSQLGKGTDFCILL